MNKMTKSEKIAVILAVIAALCSLSATVEKRDQIEEPRRPVYPVFEDHSPKPPAESVDTTPPLSAYEVVRILNSCYEEQARENSEPAPEAEPKGESYGEE